MSVYEKRQVCNQQNRYFALTPQKQQLISTYTIINGLGSLLIKSN